MKPAHRSASAMLGHALTLGGGDAWEAFAALLEARLTPEERISLAWGAMRALDPGHVSPVALDAARKADMPLPPLFGALEDAEWWVGIASEEERDAVALAAVQSMSLERRREFLKYLNGVIV